MTHCPSGSWKEPACTRTRTTTASSLMRARSRSATPGSKQEEQADRDTWSWLPRCLLRASCAACRRGVWVELRVAEFDLAAAVQEDAEDDADGVGRDLDGDLVADPVAGSGDGGEVVLGIVPGIRRGRPPSLAGDAEHQSGAVGDVGGTQVAAEGDGAAAVVVGFDLLAEEGESGGSGHGRGQNHPPVLGGAGIVLVVGPGHLA